MYYFKFSISHAIDELFPTLKIDRPKFLYKKSQWSSDEKQRKFFEAFAEKRNFNLLEPQNWYSVTIADVSSLQGARVLSHYGNSLSNALVSLFLTLD